MSENKPTIYIDEVFIKDYKCFKGENVFRFVDDKNEWCQWTVFLGNNNTGKTNLLKAIVNTPFLELIGEKDKFFLISAYGVIRELEEKGIKSEISRANNVDNLFNNTKLINFEDWLFQLDYAANNQNASDENRKKASQRRDLLKSLLTSEIFPEIENIRFVSDENLNNYIEYQTEFGWHKISDLGYGYQATLSWIVDFSKRLFDKYPQSENPLKEPAILLVDEIDLHLHPHWQRTLTKYLSNIFTQTQFIVTTHSSFVIQSMDKVNLYSLHHVRDGVNVKHWGIRSFIGWGVEEILSEVMGLENDIHSDAYQELIGIFDRALDEEDYSNAKTTYDKLIHILHPQSPERKLLDIQMSQLIPDDK